MLYSFTFIILVGYPYFCTFNRVNMLFNVEYFILKNLTQNNHMILKILLTEQKQMERFNLKLHLEIYSYSTKLPSFRHQINDWFHFCTRCPVKHPYCIVTVSLYNILIIVYYFRSFSILYHKVKHRIPALQMTMNLLFPHLNHVLGECIYVFAWPSY